MNPAGPWPMIPGVPAAGHVDRGGAWHPGGPDACSKGRCGYDKEQAAAEKARQAEAAARRRRRREER